MTLKGAVAHSVHRNSVQIRKIEKTGGRRRASVASFATVNLSREQSGKLTMLYFASFLNPSQGDEQSFVSYDLLQGLLDGCVGAHVPRMQG